LILPLIYVSLAVVYAVLLLLMRKYWHTSSSSLVPADFSPAVSLVVPARNEAAVLPLLMDSLMKQAYPNLQVILVDDFSEDETWKLLQQAVGEATRQNKSWLALKSVRPGKKAALSTAIAQATGEMVVTTDADCVHHPDWISEMIKPFFQPHVQLVGGPIMPMEARTGFLSVFQQIEGAGLILVMRFSYALGLQFTCSGNNLAYRKSAFEAVGGFQGNEHFLSGDDEFLLKKIIRLFGKQATAYVHSNAQVVATKSEPTWGALFSQRARWASKWRSHGSITHVLSAALPFAIQLLYLSSFYLLFTQNWLDVGCFALLWLSKILAEYVAIRDVLRHMNLRYPLRSFVACSFFHPLYALITAYGVFVRGWEWKGRRQA
jgi:biofilm PGA synthesis N-glycosyltransferase PgaC